MNALAVFRLSSARGLATSIEPFVDEGFGKYAGTINAELPNTLPGGQEWEIALVAQGLLVKQPQQVHSADGCQCCIRCCISSVILESQRSKKHGSFSGFLTVGESYPIHQG